MRIYSGTWLTSKRLRAHALLVGATLWSLYVWTLATPGLRDRNNNLKGTDFLHFYTLGSLAREHRGADLYDMDKQAALAVQRVPEAVGIRYLPLYPPQVSILFAPFARFSYGWALALWWICSGLIYSICCYSVWRTCPNLRKRAGLVALLAVAFPAFFHLIAWGQTSALALACFTLMFLLLRNRREFFAGLVLGCLIFKPQLGLAAGIVFVVLGAWKIVAGAIVGAAFQLAAGFWYYGQKPLWQWIHMLANTNSLLPLLEPKPYQTHCLRTFWAMIVPWTAIASALYLISAVVVLALTLVLWRRAGTPLALRYSALLLASVLISPHLTVYDLVILAPALLLLTDWLLTQPTETTGRMGTLLYLVYILPLFTIVTRWTHVQLSVAAMIALLYAIERHSRSREAAQSQLNNF
jgi:alpha-1,2-mannosyltransferase